MMLRITILVAVLAVAAACGDPSDDADGGIDYTRVCLDAPCDTPEPGPTSAITLTPHTPAPSATADPPTATPEMPVATAVRSTGTIEGYVHIGPTCPVVRESEDCDDRPHEADLDVFDGTTLITTVWSDINGNFSAPLPAGAYRLVPSGDGRLPYASEQTFTIEVGRITLVDVAYDSGIR